VVVVTCLGSLRLGRPQLGAPLVGSLTLASVVLLGLPAAAVAAVAPTSRMGNGTYWTVAVQHYLFFGAATVGVLVALVYWAPKLWGRRMPAGAGLGGFGLLLLGAHLTFLPMYVLGLQEMPRHTPAYPTHESWQAANVISTGGGYLLGLGLLVLLVALAAVAARGPSRTTDDAADPWQGHTLEWATTSPPPPHNFDALPEVRSERPLLDLRDLGEVD
jgi:cytochrome c oxidase subunit 1/cytochrome c oxidase subunit I+III